MTNLLECPVCLEKEGIPKALVCLHWLCLTCAADMVKTSDNGSLTCPQCRVVTHVTDGNVENLIDDFRTKQLKDILNNDCTVKETEAARTSNEWTVSKYTCTNDLNLGIFKCRECDVHLCEECKVLHRTRSIFANHNVCSSQKVTCQKHNKDFVYICQKCPRLLCGVCVQKECIVHESYVHSITELAPQANMKLNSLISDLQKEIKFVNEDMKPVQRKVSQYKADALKIKDEINLHCDSLIKTVNTNRYELLQDVCDKYTAADDFEMLLNVKTPDIDNLEILLATAKSVKNSEVEEVLLSLSNIESSLPHQQNHHPYKFDFELVFDPMQSLDVGSLCEKSSSDNVKLKYQFRKDKIVCDGYSILFNQSGQFIVLDSNATDGDDKFQVRLVDNRGKVHGVYKMNKNTYYSGIACMHTRNCILVLEDLYNVTVLYGQNLSKQNTIKLQSIAGLTIFDIQISMDDENIVAGFDNDSIAVFSMNGKLKHKWSKYEHEGAQKRLVKIQQICVDTDCIWVSCNSTLLLSFNFGGEVVKRLANIPEECCGIVSSVQKHVHLSLLKV